MRPGRFSLFGVLLCCGSWAAGVAALEEAPQPVTAELIAGHASVQPGGKTRVGIYFNIEPGWHIYAQDPGDAGLPTKAIWTSLLPSGAYIETPPQWPPAQTFIDPGDIHTFGYSGTLLLAATLNTMAQISVTEISVTAHVEWLACREICLPGKADLELMLPVSTTPPALSPHAKLFASTNP